SRTPVCNRSNRPTAVFASYSREGVVTASGAAECPAAARAGLHWQEMAHADTPSLSRLRPRTISMRTFQRAAVATLVILWLVVTTGGLVRLTASGLGCPH